MAHDPDRPQARDLAALGGRGARAVGAAAVVLTFAALIAGCGSTYAKRDFIARADAICTSSLRKIRAIPPPSFNPGANQQPSGLALYLARVLPLVRSEATQLRGLPRPVETARDRVALTRYLDGVAQAVSDYSRLAATARRADAQGVASAEAALRASGVASLGASYGLRVCGAPGGTSA